MRPVVPMYSVGVMRPGSRIQPSVIGNAIRTYGTMLPINVANATRRS